MKDEVIGIAFPTPQVSLLHPEDSKTKHGRFKLPVETGIDINRRAQHCMIFSHTTFLSSIPTGLKIQTGVIQNGDRNWYMIDSFNIAWDNWGSGTKCSHTFNIGSTMNNKFHPCENCIARINLDIMEDVYKMTISIGQNTPGDDNGWNPRVCFYLYGGRRCMWWNWVHWLPKSRDSKNM
jgi:hypothetical protein